MNPNLSPRQFGDFKFEHGPGDPKDQAAVQSLAGGYQSRSGLSEKSHMMDRKLALWNQAQTGMGHLN